MPVLLDMAISLDGHIGVAGQTDPGLYDWYFDPSPASRPIVDELTEITGAIVLGRGAFGHGDDAGGWDETPYDVRHVVVTHRPPSRPLTGPVDFVFVEGVEAAVDVARRQPARATSRSAAVPTSPGSAWRPDWSTRSSSTSCRSSSDQPGSRCSPGSSARSG